MRTVKGLAELGRRRFDYDPKTGRLSWRDTGPEAFKTLKGYRIFKAKFAGREAGSLHSDGYIRVYVQGRSLCAHRIIWAMTHGRDPEHEIDHRDLCRSNNRLANLREATHGQNRTNSDLRADNTSGFKGVCWHKATEKWAAAVRSDGRSQHLGVFETAEAAASAYRAAAVKAHGQFARIPT